MDVVAWWTGAALLALCLLAVLALVVLRVVRVRRERRREGARTPIWRGVMLVATAEDDEVLDVQQHLEALDRRAVATVEQDVFALLPKLRGAGAERVRALLKVWGSEDRAVRMAGSRSAVRRCRGLYRLGVLGDPASVPVVQRGLTDRDHVVRRTALQAAGSFADDALVRAAVLLVAGEPPLRRDLLASLDRTGLPTATVLRELLAEALPQASEGAGGVPPDAAALRRATLCAEGLGLVDDGSSAAVLMAVLERPAPPVLLGACADALGRLGVPGALPALAGLRDHPAEDVRRRAAAALGLVGGPSAVEPLTALLRDPQVEVARTAAEALRRCGMPGVLVLRSSATPVAREVLRLAALDEPSTIGAP